MAQILGLLDALAGVYARLEAIEDLLPTRCSRGASPPRSPWRSKFPTSRCCSRVADCRRTSTRKRCEGDKAVTLPRAPGLLPAIHDATVVNVPALPASIGANAGNVFRNTNVTPLLVPGGLGRRGGYLEPNGYLGSDGRVWCVMR